MDASNAQNHSIKANIAELNASLNEEITNKHSLLEQVKALEISNASFQAELDASIKINRILARPTQNRCNF